MMTGRTGRWQANRKKVKNKPLLGRPAKRNASAFLSADLKGSAGERALSGPTQAAGTSSGYLFSIDRCVKADFAG